LNPISGLMTNADLAPLVEVRRRVLNGMLSVPAVKDALAGALDLTRYTAYLKNAYHYARRSPAVIALAGSRCALSHPEVSRYLLDQAESRRDHEQWALEDLATLGVPSAVVRLSRPTPACAEIVGYEYYVSGHGHPVGLLGALYALDAASEDLGAALTHAVDNRLGLGGRGVTFLARYAAANETRTAKLTEIIRRHVVARAERARIYRVADVMSGLCVRVFVEITTAAAP
jgi:hypothetical protein